MRPTLALALTLALAGAPTAGQAVSGAPTPAEPSPAVAAAAPVDVPEVTTARYDVVVPAVDAAGVAAVTAGGGDVVADDVARGRVETPVVAGDAFQTVGLTWALGADVAGLEPQVRVRADGAWTPWRDLEPEGDPEVATPGQRGGTRPLWVGEADAVQLSFAARGVPGPDDLRLVLIDADVSDDPALAGTTPPAGSTTLAGTLQAATATAPTVISREQWGAQAPTCAVNVAPRLIGAVVHHTDGSNAYTSVAEAMAQIRADQAYHQVEREWCDIAYNFLVDKWGNIYEGLDNSLTRPVIGTHTAVANTGTVGVAMLGDYTTTTPSAATQDAVARIIGWRLGAWGLDPLSSVTYKDGTTRPRLFAHRDAVATECPGDAGYATMPAIRSAVVTYAAQPGIPPDPAFGDVSTGNPFYADIVWLKDTGITTGYPDGTYQPGGAVTREAMAAFLYRFEHGGTATPPACTGTTRVFTDVSVGHPFCGAIEALAREGVLGGWSDGTFRPGQSVTRQAMAAFLYRLASGSSAVPACEGSSRAFVDVPAGDPFCGAVEWLATTDVTTGWPDGTFRPASSITREAMAAFLHRLDTYLD